MQGTANSPPSAVFLLYPVLRKNATPLENSCYAAGSAPNRRPHRHKGAAGFASCNTGKTSWSKNLCAAAKGKRKMSGRLPSECKKRKKNTRAISLCVFLCSKILYFLLRFFSIGHAPKINRFFSSNKPRKAPYSHTEQGFPAGCRARRVRSTKWPECHFAKTYRRPLGPAQPAR